MKSKDIKLKNWPFDQGARVKLEWIGAPFRYEKKIVLPVYFSGKVNGYYTTEKLIVDWTVLASLRIQHYYVDGVITQPISPNQTEEIIITINPNYVGYFEQNYSIRGTKYTEISQTFVIKYNGERFYLPLIEVLRGIIAPNAFLLNCLFEMNSFPLYFTEQYESDLLRLHFASSYNAKYLKNEYLHHLVWLLMNNNARKVYESIASNFHFNDSLKFEWPFQTPIKLKLRVKKTPTGYTVLYIKAMLDKELQVSNLEITHPSLVRHEKSNEPRKRIILPLSTSGDYEADVTVDGRTNEFDEVMTDTLTHEYVDALVITKQRITSSKQREGIDHNTKKTVKAVNNSRSMGDIGGTSLLRGLEVKSLQNTYVNGELADFKEVLNELSRAYFVESVEAYVGELTDIGERSFAFLDDGITPRKYIVAYVKLRNGKEVALLEVERAGRSVSTLIITSLDCSNIKLHIEPLLKYIIFSSGSWLKEGLVKWEKSLAIYKVKHTSNFKKLVFSKISDV
ncbi:Tn7-like element transposition protein TnsE [Kurthia gibsonii]|uniref:Tn7-like element transposition protein TnsE n=1 Tax=Kurthia gibsonii TaxID=33946 RepID=UPI003F26CB9D